jgi:hypothetical protein
MEWESTQSPAPGNSIVGLNYSMTSCINLIQSIITVAKVLSNTLMKLAKGSKFRIRKIELEATHEPQTSSHSSKSTVQDDFVRECHYVCNQNFDQRIFTIVLHVWLICGRCGISPKKVNRCRRYTGTGAKIS